MDEFKDLPPLSPEHLAELVSASPDDDDPFTRHWFTGKYVDQGLEATYQIFHLRLWAPRARLLFGTMAILLFVTSHNSNWNEFTLKSQLFTLHPAVYAASNHARWLACGLMMAISLGFDRIATPDNYQRLVFIAVAVPIIIDTFPLLSFGAQSASEERDLATPSFSSWLQDPVRTARACYWHATITDFGMTLLSGMSGLTPINCLLLGATLVLFYSSQLIVVWRVAVESPRGTLSNVTVVPWQCKIIIVVAVFLVSSLADVRQRQEFRIKHLLQQLSDEHVKQLEREKEGLVTKLPRKKGQDTTFARDSFGRITLTPSTEFMISRGPRSEFSTSDTF